MLQTLFPKHIFHLSLLQ